MMGVATMANGHGGSRTPRQPAPVSGPGQLARRTDGGPQQTAVPMTGMAYGENADFNDIQSSAPMAAAPSVSNARVRNTSPTGQSAAATPLFAPTGRPGEPVTAGAPFGPGPGPSQTMNMPTKPRLSDTLGRVSSFSSDPTLKALADMLSRRGL